MHGVDRVFHIAGTTSMRRRDRARSYEINVRGTRNVMEEALGAGVEGVVHTSSVAAIGPARAGRTADETQLFDAGELGIAYVNSKHEAELESMRAAARGLPVVVVNPSFVLGPGEPGGSSVQLIRRFLLRQVPVYVDGGLNIVDVRDVATGHLLADERGVVGERYILGGRNFTLARLFADLGRISGVEPPPLRVPPRLALLAIEAAERAGVPLPVSSDEARSGMQWWTYRSTKARHELGFVARPHEETLEETVKWQAEQLGDRVGHGPRPDMALRALDRALGLAGRIIGR
jgi:dihydroflavonol-4-reductase